MPSFPTDVVDRFVALDEVAIAEGEVEGVAILIGDDGQPTGQFGPPTLGTTVFDRGELGAVQLRTGRWPQTADEVAIDAGTATAQGWSAGDRVGVVLDGPVEDVEVVGTFGLGELDNLAGASVVVLDRDTALARLGTDGALGAGFGLVAAWGLQVVLGPVGIELPGALVVLPRTVVVAVTKVAVAAPVGRGIVSLVLGALGLVVGIGALGATLTTDAGVGALGVDAVEVVAAAGVGQVQIGEQSVVLGVIDVDEPLVVLDLDVVDGELEGLATCGLALPIAVLVVPGGQLTAGVVVAAVAGLLAGVVPARRAAGRQA